jgi:hypothetical protein
MTDTKLCYLSIQQLVFLKEGIKDNIECYKGDGFSEYASSTGWSIPTEVTVNLDILGNLSLTKGSADEVKNSLVVWRALHRMTPALATENRIWSRLSHIEGFTYSKARWLKLNKTDDDIVGDVQKHFFAASLTRYRDDHAIARLWWNAYIAKLLWPHDQEGALKLMLSTADVRSNLVERPLTFGRLEVGRALLRFMATNPNIYAEEKDFRVFIKKVNKFGGRYLYEKRDSNNCDAFMNDCWNKAYSELSSA